MELECYDENKAFGIDMLAHNPLLGTATVDLKLVIRSKVARLLRLLLLFLLLLLLLLLLPLLSASGFLSRL